jgi:hypothetical protein
LLVGSIIPVPAGTGETYRAIAEKTQVALGMVNWVVKDLK